MSIPDDVIEAMAARSFAAYVQNGDSGKDTPDGWVNNRRIAEIRAAIAAAEAKGGHVLDPFGGAGTTGLVAKQEGRAATLIELNPDYAAMARARIDAEEVQEKMFG